MAQTTSELWKALWAKENTVKEHAFAIGGVWYGPESEVEHNYEASLYTEFGIGNASCATLSLGLYADDIPRGAEIKRYVRLKNGDQVSEWLPKGVFWANRRKEDDGYWTIEAFDGMRKADKVWEPDQNLEFPMTMAEAVAVIAGLMGVAIDSRTVLSDAYTIDYPTSEQTLRQTLGWIAAAHGGNFIMSDTGELWLVPLAPYVGGGLTPTFAYDTTHNVGMGIVSFSDNGVYDEIAGFRLWLDDENHLDYVVGKIGDNLLVVEADCPYATKTMVQDLWMSYHSFVYHPYDAGAADIDPAMELGDGIIVNGISSVISCVTDDGRGYPSLSAPGEAEMEDEYPFEGPVTQAFNGKIAETRSLITKTAEEIRLEILGEDGALTALVTSLEDGVAVITRDDNGNIQTITLKDGVVTADKIAAGAITADKLNVSGAITFGMLSSDVEDAINDAYSMAEDAEAVAAAADEVVSGWCYGSTTYIDGTKIMAGTVMASTLLGGSVSLLTSSEEIAGTMAITGASTSGFAVDLTSGGALRLLADDGAVYLAAYCDGATSGRPAMGLGKAKVTSPLGSVSEIYTVSVQCNSLYPAQDTGCVLGHPTLGLWSAVYSDTDTILTSDRNRKNSIEELPEKYVTMFDGLVPVRFKMNNGTSDRYHVGFVAQDVYDKAMTPAGVDAQEFGGFVKDLDADGNDFYMLRYAEFIGILAAKIKQLERRIIELEG